MVAGNKISGIYKWLTVREEKRVAVLKIKNKERDFIVRKTTEKKLFNI